MPNSISHFFKDCFLLQKSYTSVYDILYASAIVELGEPLIILLDNEYNDSLKTNGIRELIREQLIAHCFAENERITKNVYNSIAIDMIIILTVIKTNQW